MHGVGRAEGVIDRPLKPEEAKRLIIAALRDGPKTSWDLAKLIQQGRPDIRDGAADNRGYLALRRLDDNMLAIPGEVCRSAAEAHAALRQTYVNSNS